MGTAAQFGAAVGDVFDTARKSRERKEDIAAKKQKWDDDPMNRANAMLSQYNRMSSEEKQSPEGKKHLKATEETFKIIGRLNSFAKTTKSEQEAFSGKFRSTKPGEAKLPASMVYKGVTPPRDKEILETKGAYEIYMENLRQTNEAVIKRNIEGDKIFGRLPRAAVNSAVDSALDSVDSMDEFSFLRVPVMLCKMDIKGKEETIWQPRAEDDPSGADAYKPPTPLLSSFQSTSEEAPKLRDQVQDVSSPEPEKIAPEEGLGKKEIRVSSSAEANKLPKGSIFIHTNGNKYRVVSKGKYELVKEQVSKRKRIKRRR